MNDEERRRNREKMRRLRAHWKATDTPEQAAQRKAARAKSNKRQYVKRRAENLERERSSARERTARYRAKHPAGFDAQRQREARAADLDRYRERDRVRAKVDRNGREYQAWVEVFGEVCWICKKPPRDEKLYRDHCHYTGEPRGLAHKMCNVVLGIVESNPEIATHLVETLAAALKLREKAGLEPQPLFARKIPRLSKKKPRP